MPEISMQCLNKNGWKLLKLQIAQCKDPKNDLDVIMSEFNTHKNTIKYSWATVFLAADNNQALTHLRKF